MSDLVIIPDPATLEQRLRQHVERIAGRPRPPWTPEHSQTREYIRQQLSASGFAVRESVYQEAGLTAFNLLTEPLPQAEGLPLVLIAAHYDSTPDSPGADDNASGVAALLELATWLRPLLETTPLHAQIQLAAYDLEEYGMIGSYLHARELHRAGRKLRGMISLEMLGYAAHQPGSQGLPAHLAHLYPDVGNFIGVCGNFSSEPLVRAVVQGMKRVGGLPVEFLTVPGKGEMLREVRLSDHSPFWDLDYPALMITDTSFFRNPHYHQVSDTPETLDYAFLGKVTASVCAATWWLLTADSL